MGNGNLDFVLAFNVRGKNTTLRTSGYCKDDPPGGGMRCQVECDGGGVYVVHRAKDLMMHRDRIRVVGSCDDASVIDSGEDLSGGKDDRNFRLDRVRAAVCAGMVP